MNAERMLSDIAPEDAINVTLDGGVRKVVLHEGNGEIPPKYSRCIGRDFSDPKIWSIYHPIC